MSAGGVALNRLFLALWPDEAVRAACADAARDLKLRMQPAGRWIPAERYHLTLAFLGNTVSEAQEAAVRRVAAAVRVAPFALTLDHAGSFRKRQAPWWLGARTPPPALLQLVEQLHAGLRDAQVLPDRERFVPHLTVLRDAARALPETAIKPIAWPVHEFVLVRSRLDLQPVAYETVGRWPLIPPAGPDQLDLWET